MSYVILNGVNSNTIRGLLIQSLPPISKPLMRTEVYEVDGRDGDITTKLGYSAYDKEMVIGLHGNFDINEVIRFFDSEGVVTFSSEPDKYYKYQIIEQIDFERLVRFRVATVTFHVQPFKYSVNEEPITAGYQLLNVDDFYDGDNTVHCIASNGVIDLKNSTVSYAEFFIPIDPLTLEAGNYTLKVKTTGNNADRCTLALTEGESLQSSGLFGGTTVQLSTSEVQEIHASLSGTKTYNYLYVSSNVQSTSNLVNVNIHPILTDDDHQISKAIEVVNSGNTVSKPKISLRGTGTVDVIVGGIAVFEVNFESEFEYITIDSELLEAYDGSTLKNRQVVGDYDRFVLQSGENLIVLRGDAISAKLENYSRWI